MGAVVTVYPTQHATEAKIGWWARAYENTTKHKVVSFGNSTVWSNWDMNHHANGYVQNREVPSNWTGVKVRPTS